MEGERRPRNAYVIAIAVSLGLVVWLAVDILNPDEAAEETTSSVHAAGGVPDSNAPGNGSGTSALLRTPRPRASSMASDAAPSTLSNDGERRATRSVPHEPGGNIEVRVVSEDGRPVAGAEVRFTSEGTWGLGHTKNDGVLLLEGVPLISGRLLVTADGFIPHGRRGTGCPAGTRREEVIVLAEGHLATGRVVDDETGVPIAEAYLIASSTREYHARIADALADEQGAFRIPLDPGPMSVTMIDVLCDGYAVERRLVKPDPLVPGLFPPLEIRVCRGIRVRGRVVGPGGVRIDGAQVRVAGSSWEATTDTKGRFECTVARWPPRDGPLTLLGYAEEAGCGICVLEAVEGPVPEAVLHLEGTGTVEGQVHDGGESRVGVRGEVVHLRPRAGLVAESSDSGVAQLALAAHRPRGFAAPTSSDGSFLFPAIPQGLYDLDIGYGSTCVRRAEGVSVKTGVRSIVELALDERRSSIEGQVVDESGRPIAGAVVDARPSTLASAPRAQSVTNAEGRFRLAGWVDREELDVEVRAPGFVPARLAGVHAGPRSLRLVLLPMASIVGRVTIDERPFEGVIVLSLESERKAAKYPGWTLNVRNGRFQMRGVPTGRHVLRARTLDPVHIAQPIEIEAEDGKTIGPVVLRMHPASDEDR